METWVLVLFIGAQSMRGVSMTSVPGYASETECKAAGQVYMTNEEIGGSSRWGRFQCIPGPKR